MQNPDDASTQASHRLFAGHRLRETRKRLGYRQHRMARQLGISVSYLSQIESGDRPMTPAVMLAFATAFPMEWAEIVPEDEAALLIGAMAAGTDPSVPEQLVPADLLRRAAQQQPALARRLIAVHAAYNRSQSQIAALDDRLNHGAGEPARSPWEEVRDWFYDAGNYLDELDRAAEALHHSLADDMHSPDEAIERRLRDAHDVTLVRATERLPDAAQVPLSEFDSERRRLAIDRSLPPESRAFFLAHQLVRLELAELLATVARDAALGAEGSRELLAVGLANYAAGALLMPYARFREAAQVSRHDIDQLRQQFGVSFEQVCHRLSTLQRPGLRGLPFFFCRVDMAGNITKRHSATPLQFARFGGACPLWIVHEAVAIPDRILVQLAELPDGTRYVSMAKGLVKATGSYNRPARRYAVALGCEITHADNFVYADQLALRDQGSATPIGISCRICLRTDCDQRAFPPSGRPIAVNRDRRMAVPYVVK